MVGAGTRAGTEERAVGGVGLRGTHGGGRAPRGAARAGGRPRQAAGVAARGTGAVGARGAQSRPDRPGAARWTPAKVRSLVFQARGSLISTRDARDTPCGEIRLQISTLAGSSLRRRTLRRHVRACAGCREFEAAVRGQQRNFALILPVTAGAGLRGAALQSAVGGRRPAAGQPPQVVSRRRSRARGRRRRRRRAGGVLGGLVGVVAGSGVAQITAVVAIAATGHGRGGQGTGRAAARHRGGRPSCGATRGAALQARAFITCSHARRPRASGRRRP